MPLAPEGALALDFRLGPGTRATQDMDLDRDDDEAASTADFRAAEATDLGDWFDFAIARTGALDRIVDRAAVRYEVTATLAGRSFERVTVDIGFGGSPPAPDALRGPDLLAFAGIVPITVPALPLGRHVAEKLHAYTRDYGGDRQNTRVKDLVDLVLIQAMTTFEAGSLRETLAATFAARACSRSRRRSRWHRKPGRHPTAYKRARSGRHPTSRTGSGRWRRSSTRCSRDRWTSGRTGIQPRANGNQDPPDASRACGIPSQVCL